MRTLESGPWGADWELTIEVLSSNIRRALPEDALGFVCDDNTAGRDTHSDFLEDQSG